MKVGADGVTLGAWADVSNVKHALDVGCGSGLITLMIAQRSDAYITAIDIDEQSVIQTRENITESPWQNRIDVHHSSLQDFVKNAVLKFDLIVCNPPFFINSMKSPSSLRTLARHNDSLPFSDLINNSKRLLADQGRLCIILPKEEGRVFIEEAERNELFCVQQVTVFPNYQKPAKRLLLEFSLAEKIRRESQLTIEEERGVYAAEYTDLVKDFYLKL